MLTQTLRHDTILSPLTPAPGHSVQFYDEGAFPAQSIADFLCEGIHAQESAVVIATQEHVVELRASLEVSCAGLNGAESDGRLTLLDAQATLDRFIEGGVLERERATAELGAVLDQARAASPSGTVRVFGEMVAVLTAQGNYAGAIQLEQLWSQLLQARPFRLYCAYAIQQFLHESMRETFQHICDEHDEVVPVLTWLDKPERQGRWLAMLQQQNHALQREINQRIQMEAELRALAGRLQSAREEERGRLALELHDELGQVLTVLKMNLSRWSRRPGATQDGLNGAPSADEAHEMIGLADQAIRSMRRILKELRPPELETLGFLPALEAQIQDFRERTHIEAHFSAEMHPLELDEARALALYRIVQESLTNVARHAHATQVEVSLKREANLLVLEVRDNGRGLRAGALMNGHLGIVGMRERALLLGGSLEIQGADRQGTTVTVKVPLHLSDGATGADMPLEQRTNGEG